MTHNYGFGTLCQDILKAEYFEDRILGWFYTTIRDYYIDYRKKPTSLVLERELETAILAKKVKEKEKDLYVSALQKIVENPSSEDAEYVTNEVIRFAKRQAVRNVLLEVAPQTDSRDESVWDEIESKIRKACSVGTASLDIGLDYFSEINQRLASRAQYETKLVIPVGIPDLDQVLSGGLKAGQLGIILGFTGGGKSVFLPHVGRRALINGYKVVHYTLELDEKDIADRYDASFSNINITDLIPKEREVEKKLTALNTKYGNSLVIKFYPTQSASVPTLRTHLNQLEGLGFVPDLVIVDYGDLLKATSKYNDPYSDLGHTFADLRGLAGEKKIPIWTASQLNRAGGNAELADIGHMGDSIKKAHIADVIIAISATRDEKDNNQARLHVAKNRNGPSNVVIPITTNYAKMKFYEMNNNDEDEPTPSKFRRKPKAQDDLF